MIFPINIYLLRFESRELLLELQFGIVGVEVMRRFVRNLEEFGLSTSGLKKCSNNSGSSTESITEDELEEF